MSYSGAVPGQFLERVSMGSVLLAVWIYGCDRIAFSSERILRILCLPMRKEMQMVYILKQRKIISWIDRDCFV
jgi:hypothetical protein